MVKQPMPARQIRVGDKLWEEARTSADRNDETVSEVIRRALIQYVKENQS